MDRYQVGSIFLDEEYNDYYVLARIESTLFNFISLTDGNRWSTNFSALVDDDKCISADIVEEYSKGFFYVRGGKKYVYARPFREDEVEDYIWTR